MIFLEKEQIDEVMKWLEDFCYEYKWEDHLGSLYFTRDELADAIRADLEEAWEGPAWYEIGFSDGFMRLTPEWCEEAIELVADLFLAYQEATETHLPWVGLAE